MASDAGVHPGTASRALSPEQRHLVSPDTRKRVEAAARRLEFRPDTAARSLRTRRSYTVGVLIPDLNNPLFPPIVRGIDDRLAQSGYVALLGNTDNDQAKERRVFDGMRSRLVDGLIVATARRQHPLLERAAAEDLAIVLVNRVLEGHEFSSASVDDGLGVRLAVAHLARLGHRRIAHLAGPQDVSTGRGRYQGFLLGMAEMGLEVDPRLVAFTPNFSQAEGMRACRQILRSEAACTAIVAGNDLLALGCYSALDEAGLKCPEMVSVVGFNDMPFIDRLRPPLTSIRIPHYQMGAEAARLVLERIADRHRPVSAVFLAPELVVRGSTAPAPA